MRIRAFLIDRHGVEMGPKVSVIISLFRGERYLEKFLDNILEQTWFDDIEFVIDHNEPTEKELHLIRRFQRDHPERIKHLIREKVVPYGASWNRCIVEASADIVTIWNVDDMRTPDSIELEAKPIMRGEADLVFGNHVAVRHHGDREGDLVRLCDIPPRKYLDSFVFGPFFMFNRSLCDKVGFLDEQMRSSSDFDFGVRLAQQARIKAIDENLGYYLDEGRGLSTRANSKWKIENTVIALRYGNYDHLYYDRIPQALGYDVRRIKSNGEWSLVSSYFPDYQAMFKRNVRSTWFKGPFNYVNGQFQEQKRRLKRAESA